MRHNIAYYRAIHGTNGVNSAKEARVRAFQRETQRAFQKTINWEIVEVKRVKLDCCMQQDLIEQELQIIPSNDPLVKQLKSRPQECLCLGDIIQWRGTYWIVNVVDADDLICCSAQMVQCNICFRWQLDDGTIHEEYGWDKDGSKYSFGEDRTRYMDTPDFIMKAILQVNEYTLSIRRNMRFLLGLHVDGENPLAVEVSRINSITNTYKYEDGNRNQNTGLLEITIHETQFNPETDNIELGIANYRTVYKDEERSNTPETPPERTDPLDPVNNEGGEWF